MTVDLEEHNARLRDAVADRMASTSPDDPKMVGYRLTGDGVLNANAETYAAWTPPAYATETVAEATLRRSLEAVRDRHGKYGPPSEHFARTAALVNAAFGTTFTAADWALVMVLDKVSRQMGTSPTSDSAVDIAGYAACHEECRVRE